MRGSGGEGGGQKTSGGRTADAVKVNLICPEKGMPVIITFSSVVFGGAQRESEPNCVTSQGRNGHGSRFHLFVLSTKRAVPGG